MKSRKFVTLAAAATMAFVATGCGAGSATSTSGSTTAAAPSSDNVLKVGTTAELSGVFVPLYTTTGYDQWVVNMVFESLMGYNAESERENILLAEDPVVSEDGTTYTFKLKTDQKFSDGSVLDGDDVKYSFTLLADPAYIGEKGDGQLDFIKGWKDYQYGDATEVSGITVSDDKQTITIETVEPNIDALPMLTGVAVLPNDQVEYTKGNLDAYKNMAPEDVIGSGPYKVNKYDKSAGTSVVRNENYTGEGEYKIESVIIRTISNGTEVAALESGEIDYLSDQIDTSIIGPASALPNVDTNHYFRPAEGYFGFNTASGPTADLAVRKALAYATNRDEFGAAYFKWPEGQVADDIKDVSTGYVPKAFWSPVAPVLGEVTTGDREVEGLETYDFDLEKAKSLLDEAGWKPGADGIREKDGQKLEIKFLATENNAVLDMLIPMISATWKDLGVDLKTNTVDFNTMATTVEPTNEEGKDAWNIFFMAVSFTGLSNVALNNIEGFQGTVEDPTLGGSNYARIIDEELNNYLIAGKKTADLDVSIENYEKAMVRGAELVPYFPIYGNHLFNLFNKRVKDLKTGPVSNWSGSLADAYLSND